MDHPPDTPFTKSFVNRFVNERKRCVAVKHRAPRGKVRIMLDQTETIVSDEAPATQTELVCAWSLVWGGCVAFWALVFHAVGAI